MSAREPSGPQGLIRIFFWRGRVLYLGPVNDNELHEHHAVQAAVSPGSPLDVTIGEETVRTRAMLIDADQPHQLDSLGQTAAVFLIEPESRDADRLRRGHLQSCGHRVIDHDLADSVVEALSPLNSEDTGCAEASRCFDRMLATWGAEEAPPVRDERIDTALVFIQELPQKKISLAELASQVFLSEGRFIHLFTEQVGIPPRRYLLWARLMDAVALAVRGSDLTTAAHCVGFADAAHLSRTFKRMFGQAPSFLTAGAKNSRFVQAFLCSEYYLPS